MMDRLLSSTLLYSKSMMTGYKPRQISHLHLSIRRFAEAHDCHCRGRYTVEVDIDPSHIIYQYIMHQTDVCCDVACVGSWPLSTVDIDTIIRYSSG